MLPHSVLFAAAVFCGACLSLPFCNAINIGLHAQGNFKNHHWVAGSEITTRGMRKALLKYPFVDKVELFAPFMYEPLLTERWDLLLIEGFTGPVPKVIRLLRHKNPNVIILHYCLDTYPSLEDVILKLDVDGFLTNSHILLPHLSALAPTEYVALAADPEEHRPKPAAAGSQYDIPVVYLGQFKDTKFRLKEMLREAMPFGLAIYGNGWAAADAGLRRHWRGILPLDDIAELYSTAGVVLGTTEIKQRDLGMVNNRVFEALSCGALFVSDHFPELERVCGDHVWYAKKEGDVARHLDTILNLSLQERAAYRERGRSTILQHHSYDNRVGTILDLYKRLAANKHQTIRRNRLSVGVVTDSLLLPSYLLQHSFNYNFHVMPSSSPIAAIVRHDMVLVYDVMCGASDLKIRNVTDAASMYTGKSFALIADHGHGFSEKCASYSKMSSHFDLRIYDFIFGSVGPFIDTTYNYPGNRVIKPTERMDQWGPDLENAIHRALFGVKARATISVVDPPANALLRVVCNPNGGTDEAENVCVFETTKSASLSVGVSFFEVATPADGLWCVVVEDVEIACQGDNLSSVMVAFPQQLLRSPLKGGKAIPVRMYARLRNTVEHQVVMSSPVSQVKLLRI